MPNSKILITINKLEDLAKLKELGIKHFVFPLKGFCVGIPNTFLISEIKEDAYILVNRVLDNKGIDDLNKILENIPTNIQGIIFDDLGVLEIVKDLKIEKILYLSHFNTNIESIKIYLEYVDSVIVSIDLERNELLKIVNTLKNKLTIFTLGYVMAMYSRRLLVANYANFHHLTYSNPLKISNTNEKFIVYENEYGTCFYHYPLFNGVSLMTLPCKYFFINSTFLSVEEIDDLLANKSNLEYDTNFLDKEIIYKLKEVDKDV